MQNSLNYPTVNYSITQDPWSKEFNINFSIKIKPDTIVKEVKATIPNIINPLHDLKPISPTFGVSNAETFQKNFANLTDYLYPQKPTSTAGLCSDPLKPISLKDLPTMHSACYPFTS